MSQVFRMRGSFRVSMYSGLTNILPGASGTKLESMCMGWRHLVSISWIA